MHRSRFAGIIIDCETDDLDVAADFWSATLGYPRKSADDIEAEVARLEALGARKIEKFERW